MPLNQVCNKNLLVAPLHCRQATKGDRSRVAAVRERQCIVLAVDFSLEEI
eukprot:m.9729 g.9729  ORF g.9729 m.9729 type:complete len:50 (+) comp7247_c0_seq1:936-1085(+)